MKAALVALSLVAFAAQHDVTAAAAGLSSADPAVRAHAACELRDLGSEAAPLLARLAAMLDDGSPVDPAVCGERTWRFRGTQEPTTPGEQAASALLAIGTSAAPVLRQALGRPAWVARRNAAWALGALKDSEAVREQVAWALGAIGDRRAVDPLVAALGDSVAGVRKQSAWALGALGDRRAVAGLTHALKDADAGVRKQAAWALGAIGA
jgi:HEAT repeat protein